MSCGRISLKVAATFVMAALLFSCDGCQSSKDQGAVGGRDGAILGDNALPSEVIQALLEMDVSSTGWKKHVPYRNSPTPPPDDASPDTLIAWWSYPPGCDGVKPSEKARQQMLELLLERPYFLGSNLSLLPNNPSVHDRVMTICSRLEAKRDVEAQTANPDDYQHEYELRQIDAIHRWLMLNSKYFRDELVAKIKASDPTKYSSESADEMRALLRLDPAAAREVLLSLGRQRKHPLAMTVLLEYSMLPQDKALPSIEPELRSGLMSVVENSEMDAGIRYYALKALAKDRWEGQELWIEKRFGDPTMREGHSGDYVYHVIAALLAEDERPVLAALTGDSDRWVPLACELLNDPNPDVHEAAVACLLARVEDGCGARPISRQAVLALLPWVDHPGWSTQYGRVSLLDALTKINVPECMPAILALLKNGAGDEAGIAAIGAAKYKDARAIPLLKKELAACKDNTSREHIVYALRELGAYTVAQQAHAISGEFEGDQGPATAPASKPVEPWEGIASEGSLLRRELLMGQAPVPALANAVIDLAGKGDPFTRNEVYDALLNWDYAPGRACLVELLGRKSSLPALRANYWGGIAPEDPLRQAKSTASFIRALLLQAEVFRKQAPTQLRGLRDMRGAKGAIGVALLDDMNSAIGILKVNDRNATLALLAAARLAQMKLPTPLVASFLDGHDPDLADAAEKFLRAEGSPQALWIVAAHHRGEYVTFGEGGIDKDLLGEFQGKPLELRGLFGEVEPTIVSEANGPPDEVWALMSSAPMGGLCQNVIVRRRGDVAELTSFYGNRNESWTRRLSRGELKDLKEFLDRCRPDELPDFAPEGVCDGVQATFVHLTRSYGHALGMDNPNLAPFSVYDRLTEYFFNLATPGPKRTATAPAADDSPATEPAPTTEPATEP